MTLFVWDSCDYDEISDFFVDIEPVEDWTKSLIKVGIKNLRKCE